MKDKDNQELSLLQAQVEALTKKLEEMKKKLKQQTTSENTKSAEEPEAIDISDINKVADAIQALADRAQLADSKSAAAYDNAPVDSEKDSAENYDKTPH